MAKTTKLQRLMNEYARSAKVDEVDVRRELAEACEVSPSFVYQWCEGLRPIPAAHALAVESFFGADKYPRHEIAPRVFREAA